MPSKDNMTQQIFSPEIFDSLELNGKDLFAAEENATFWLWAYPSLLGWHRRFEWLFSPVVGNPKYPGDLWGIDDSGNLLLVETKRGQRSDPFKSFIGYEKNNGWETTASFTQLSKRWKKLYKYEQCFWQNHTDLNNPKIEKITAKGIVPYSNKRFATRQWSVLYTNVIVPYLKEQVYVENVNQFLSARTRLVKKTTYYFGMLFVKDPCLANLSKKGEDHFLELKNLAGNDRVNLMSMTAQESQIEHSVHLQCSR